MHVFFELCALFFQEFLIVLNGAESFEASVVGTAHLLQFFYLKTIKTLLNGD